MPINSAAAIFLMMHLLIDQLPNLIESQKTNYPNSQSLQANNYQAKQHRPSIQSNNTTANFGSNINATLDPTNTAADWFMMGGGDVDSGLDLIATSEAKSVATFAEAGAGRSNSTIKRSGHKRKSSSSKNPSSNRTTFDDEQSDSSDSNEIFDDVEEASTISGTQKEPDCASRGRYYCTYKEEYPLKLVTEVTKYYKWPLEKLFRDLHAQIMPKLAQDSTGNLVCDSITRVVRPGWARNTNERWLVVINTENYHQYVTEVVCQYGSNSRCNFIPPCYYSSCQQRYNTQKLLVIDPTNPYRGPFLSEFLFPSCCVCYVPSSSDTFQDKYRSSPATIYQRTMQQESSNNIYPPQFRPATLIEEAPASLIDQPQASASRTSGSSSKQSSSSNLALAPGEIRRAGETYNKRSEGQVRRDLLNVEKSESFPRLGMSDSLINTVDSDAKDKQQ